MEQLKPFLNFLNKNKFWLCSGLLAVASVVTWFLAAGAVDAAKDQDIQTLNGKISELEGVLKVSAEGLPGEVKAHPNDSSKQGMEQRLAEARDATLKAWKMRREAQEPIMVWPEEVLKSPEFVKFFAQFSPPEAFDKIPQEKVATYLQMYTREIPKRMPEICKVIGTKWDAAEEEKAKEKAKDASKSGSGDSPSAAVDKDGGLGDDIVFWNADNQKLWQDKLTQFNGFDGNTQMFATAYQAFALQQDLWLLEAMFKVIKEVNGAADANDLAAIREIDHIAFGRDCRAKVGELSPIDKRLADASVTDAALAQGGGPALAPPGGPAPPANAGQGGAPGAGQAFANLEASDPLVALGPFHGRYVGPDGEPLPIQKVHDVLKLSNKTLPDQDLELVVAKRVPVRIALKMEENKIPAFIAACANSPFGFEINQVRLNRHKPGEGIELNGGAKAKSSSSGGGASGRGRDNPTAGMGGSGSAGLDGGGEEESSSKKSTGSTGPMAAESRTNLLVDVEFSGIVKIYNPVNESRLKSGAEQAGMGGVPGAPAANPGGRP